MYDWLLNPKVRLGLLVNALYVIGALFPSPHQGGARRHAGARAWAGVGVKTRPTARVPLPTAAGWGKATSYPDGEAGGLTIYLEDDLKLTGSRGRRLILSPTFTVRDGDGSPDSVLLRFVSFSDEPLFSGGARFAISADGRRVWPAYDADGELVWEGWAEETVPPQATRSEQGDVEENVGKTIPYEVFADVIRAKRVVINLGPHLVELSGDHLEALRDMHRLIPRSAVGGFYGGRY